MLYRKEPFSARLVRGHGFSNSRRPEKSARRAAKPQRLWRRKNIIRRHFKRMSMQAPELALVRIRTSASLRLCARHHCMVAATTACFFKFVLTDAIEPTEACPNPQLSSAWSVCCILKNCLLNQNAGTSESLLQRACQNTLEPSIRGQPALDSF